MVKGGKPDPQRPSAVIEEGGLRHRSQARGLLNTSNLPALQNLLKRDPQAYTDEFKQQWNHYQSLRAIYAANIGVTIIPGAETTSSLEGPSSVVLAGRAAGAGQQPSSRMAKEQEDRFRELIAFVAQLVPCYPEIASSFPRDLADLLLKHHSSLSPDLRHSAVRSLVLLHNREVIDSQELLKTLFPLLSITTSSSLRSLIQSTILSDIKNANAKAKNHRLNRIVQGLLFGVVEQGMKGSEDIHLHQKGDAEPKGKSQALWAVRLAADLWRKSIWNDAKTVSLMALACFHPHPKVQTSAVRFFLNDLHHAEDDGAEAEQTDSDEDEPVIPDVSKLKHARKVNKKTRSGDRKVRAAAATAKKRNKAKAAKAEEASGNFAAVYLLNDPQSFGEKIFENLSRGDKRHPIEVKIRLMQLLSRVMGVHKLCVLSFYSYIVKYLAPHQVHVTLILVSLAQSVHEQTPPDVLTPVIRKIADSFVHPGVGPEVVAAGINSIREISKRQPWCMEETLLEDLISYRKSKDKGVAAASRGLLSLYREVNPGMLSRKERGKMGSMAVQAGAAPRAFGMPEVGTQGIQGLDLLEEHYAKKARGEGSDDEEDGEDGEDAGWKDWELESDSDDDDSDDSGGWINVDSGGESDVDIDYSDSDDEDGKKNADGTAKSAKERGALRREKRRQQRQKERVRAERRARGEASESSSSSEEEDNSGSENGDEDNEEDEGEPGAKASSSAAADAVAAEAAKMSELATTRILTPADFAKLNELRLAAAEAAISTGGRSGAIAKRELAELQLKKRSMQSAGAREDDLGFLNEYDILGPRKKLKADYEERMASIAKGREDRDKFGSKKGKKLKDKTSSTTNEQKSKKKNFGMVSKSWAVRSKKKASLRDKSKALKKHKEKQSKMKGKH
ncbi:unnamed protein product [Sympodiomycopsis kandeliae]